MTSPGPVLLAVPMGPIPLLPECVILGSALFALYAAFQIARLPPGLGPEVPESLSRTARRMRGAGRGLGWSLLAIVLSVGLVAPFASGNPGTAARGLIGLGWVARRIAVIAIPFFFFCLMTAPLFGRLERQRTRALALGKSPARLRWQSLLAALLVALAYAAGMKIGLALIGR